MVGYCLRDDETVEKHVTSLELSKQLYNCGWLQGIDHNSFYWIVRRRDQKSWLVRHKEAQQLLSNRCVDVYGAPSATELLDEIPDSKTKMYLQLHYGIVRDEGWVDLAIKLFKSADSVAKVWIWSKGGVS